MVMVNKELQFAIIGSDPHSGPTKSGVEADCRITNSRVVSIKDKLQVA